MKSRSSNEAPWGATSWKDERVEAISSRDDVYVVRGPMCKWGMTATDRRGLQGTGFVRKETGWMTNHPGLAKLFETECTKDRRSTVAPPHSFDWWHSPASGKVSAAACKSCAQMFEKRIGRERRIECRRCIQCRTSSRSANRRPRVGRAVCR